MAGGGGSNQQSSGRRGTKPVAVRLNITAMMDIFVIIITFLLYNVSFETTTVSVERGIKLPASNSLKNYREHKVLISMTLDALKVNDRTIMNLQKGMIPSNSLEGEKVTPLFAELNRLREALPSKEKDSLEGSVVLFQADKRIPFKKLNPIMKTAGMAGFPNFWFAVIKEG